ncbi:MAG: WYL domain-containing protein [Tissierellia bacterium]|nr:WYL domain-containing protein [Tissierellia bacterium]
MAHQRKGENQKLKLLYLYTMFQKQTDEDHGMTMPEIIDFLKAHGVNADRKTLYQDFKELGDFGLEIFREQVGHRHYYYATQHLFELPELKLLVDSVQASKFITDKKSLELIGKLSSLTSVHQADQLQRQVYVMRENKTLNEAIYYNVDVIHQAISSQRSIAFRYTQWNLDKKLEDRKNGIPYEVSPWALLWDDENYYLIGYDNAGKTIKHYRVDKMKDTTTLQAPREGREAIAQYDLGRYTSRRFGMFGGEEQVVNLHCHNDMIGVLLDRFGTDLPIQPLDEEHFTTQVSVVPSRQFFGWIIGLGPKVTISGPKSVAQEMRTILQELKSQYP